MQTVNTWADYVPAAMRTNSGKTGSFGNQSCDFAHACLGIVSEINEIRHAKSMTDIFLEKGDLAWFIALAYQAIEMRPPAFELLPITSTGIANDQADLCDLGKKWFAHGKINSEMRQLMSGILANLIVHYSLNLDVLNGNLGKLYARYPSCYNTEDQAKRNKKNEMVTALLNKAA